MSRIEYCFQIVSKLPINIHFGQKIGKIRYFFTYQCRSVVPGGVVSVSVRLLLSAYSMFSSDIDDKLASLKNLKTTSNDGKNIVLPFLQVFQDFLQLLTSKFDDFKTEMLSITKAKDDEILGLKQQVADKDKRISNLRDLLDVQDQYVRRESLIISGDSVPSSTTNEDCIAILCDLIPKKLGADIVLTPNDISVAHRLGPKPSSGTDRRSIIARFCRRNVKYSILNKSRKAKRKDFYANESLTTTRQKIVKSIRRAKNEHPNIVSGYQTVDGSISVWVKPPNPEAEGATCSRVKVNTLEELEEFCMRNFQRSASNYMPRKHTPGAQDEAA